MSSPTQDEEKILTILRQVASDGDLKNPSKTTKDTLVAIVTYVAPRLRVPGLLEALVTAVAEPAAKNEEEDRDDEEEEDFFSASTLNTSKPNQAARVPVCKSRWTGKECTNSDCSRAHPAFCKSAECKVQGRNKDCKDWHTVRAGNGNGRAAAPSTDSKRSKSNNKQSKHNLEKKKKSSLHMQLLSSQLEAYKAKEKLAKLKQQQRQQVKHPQQQVKNRLDKSYAGTVARAPAPQRNCPSSTQLHTPPSTQLPPHLMDSSSALVSVLETALAILRQA